MHPTDPNFKYKYEQEGYKILTKPPYVNEAHMPYTSQLFYEIWIMLVPDKQTIKPIFTLYERHPKLISAQKTFVELGDPTGYKWAQKYLGSWNHFQMLLRNKQIVEALEVWREELRTKQKAEAIGKIVALSESDNAAQALAASRYLAEQAWETKRGRPSKLEQSAELKRLVKVAESQAEDAKRIGLVA